MVTTLSINIVALYILLQPIVIWLLELRNVVRVRCNTPQNCRVFNLKHAKLYLFLLKSSFIWFYCSLILSICDVVLWCAMTTVALYSIQVYSNFVKTLVYGDIMYQHWVNKWRCKNLFHDVCWSGDSFSCWWLLSRRNKIIYLYWLWYVDDLPFFKCA